MFEGPLPQPDRRSCGAASLVVARMLLEPGYAGAVGAAVAPFDREVLALHRRTTGIRDATGRLQLPWPRALGTPPWAAARHLSALGPKPMPYRTRSRFFGDRTRLFAEVTAAVDTGRPVALYLGSRWLPRHVVLAVATITQGLTVYEPSSGLVVAVPRSAFVADRLNLAGWRKLWFVVLPTA